MENRYDKYKDSGIAWIGEIPEHWKICKLKNIFLLSTGTTPKEYDKISEGDNLINWYTPSDILDGCNDLFSSQRKLSEKVIYDNKISLFPIGTLLYVGIGASAGKVGYANENGYSKDKIRDNAFFTTLPIINNVYLGQELLPYPLLSEQQSIATYLDQKCSEIDELITLQEEMITKLQSYKQSVITEAVTKGLNKNVPLKDSGIEWIGEIPEHWICTVFKKFLSEPMQYGANEPAEECNYNDPRYIRITDIKDDGTLRDDTFKSLPLEKAKEYMLTKGDLLFARSGATVGKTFLYKEDYAACFAGYLIKARCNKNELLPNFIFYYTLSNAYQNWKNSIFIQSTIQNIGADKYSVMPIIAPPLSEQQSIANYLDQKCSEIDELISIKQQKIEKLKDYKKSLIFECVTGKRKV